MKKQMPLLLYIILLFGLLTPSAYAVTISLSQVPSSIATDSFTFTASISGAASGTNYLRVDLYKDGTSNYFGETYNGVTGMVDLTTHNMYPLVLLQEKHG